MDARGGRPDTGPEGEAEARARVDALFTRVNDLTPTDLAHIGLRRGDPEERRSALDAVDEAARASGRGVLVGEAREEAKQVVLHRFDEAAMSPTWLGPAWGVSTGTAEDRVAILGALSDAAAAAVVADLVAPEVVEALSVDAEHVLGLADGEAFEGAMSRGIEPPPPGADDPPGRTAVVYGGAIIGGLLVAVSGAILVATPIGIAGGLVFALVVLAQGRRPPGERPPRRK
jgi:hypothetical protein